MTKVAPNEAPESGRSNATFPKSNGCRREKWHPTAQGLGEFSRHFPPSGRCAHSGGPRGPVGPRGGHSGVGVRFRLHPCLRGKRHLEARWWPWFRSSVTHRLFFGLLSNHVAQVTQHHVTPRHAVAKEPKRESMSHRASKPRPPACLQTSFTP